MMVRLRFLSFIWYLIRFMMFWGAIFFVLVPRGKGESYFFDKYFFAQNDMNRINIWFGLLLDRINYGTLEIFSGHLVLNSVHNISNRGKSQCKGTMGYTPDMDTHTEYTVTQTSVRQSLIHFTQVG